MINELRNYSCGEFFSSFCAGNTNLFAVFSLRCLQLVLLCFEKKENNTESDLKRKIVADLTYTWHSLIAHSNSFNDADVWALATTGFVSGAMFVLTDLHLLITN